ncbi:hypothetical protein [Methylobacterium sp. WL116]|uniref:hypothetical protein n=1 Tax=Methylobacterium sp. WL116 TaxID=2603889 RepID=UPI001FEEA541|nr:hypothetical protein [Methylobacterium sp. WL116]
MSDETAALLLALATENAKLRAALAEAQELLIKTAVDAGEMHARLEEVQCELAVARADRDAWISVRGGKHHNLGHGDRIVTAYDVKGVSDRWRRSVAKDKKSAFPGSIRNQKNAADAEAEKVSAKIQEAFGKLANKMRQRAEKAKSKMDETQKPEKRAGLTRRFELYADAATYLEERIPPSDE